jgi:uncharacterized membrane protein
LFRRADVPWSGAVSAGALFGFLAYATYDLCNLATLRGWPLRLALAETPWGRGIRRGRRCGRALGRMA